MNPHSLGRIGRIIPLAVMIFDPLLCPPAGLAKTYNKELGLGILLGNPTGGSLKAWMNETQAIDGAIGFGFLGGERLQIHSTYLWHFKGMRSDTVILNFYAGPGLALDVKESRRHPANLALRGAGGLVFEFDPWEKANAPVDLFIEAAVLLGAESNVDANLGARYWF